MPKIIDIYQFKLWWILNFKIFNRWHLPPEKKLFHDQGLSF